MSAYTAGPWDYHRGDDYIEIFQPRKIGSDRTIAIIRFPNDEDEANAKMMAAAPDMGEALNTIIQACQTKDYRDPLTHAQISDIARAALAKAGVA